MALEISVLIPHYNDLANLDRCLDLLDRQTLPHDSFEIIVADNNSPVGIEAVRALVGRRARVVPAPEQGAGPARNAAAGAARSAAFAFTDSDCLPDADWLERGLAALQRADIVGGAVTTTASDPAHPTPSEAFELVFAFQIQHYVEHKGFCVTANLFVKRSAFETVGGFRNGISEDEEWGRRAITKGYRTVYAPEVRISHPARRNWEELRRKLNRLTRERYVLTREQRLGRIVWIARSWLILISPVFHSVKVLLSPQLKSARSRLDAIAILFRSRVYRFAESYRVMFSDLGTAP